jgi:hypothetical protein
VNEPNEPNTGLDLYSSLASISVLLRFPLCTMGAAQGKQLTDFENADADPLSYEAIDEAISNMSPEELLDFDTTIGNVYGMTPEQAKNGREATSVIYKRGGGDAPFKEKGEGHGYTRDEMNDIFICIEMLVLGTNDPKNLWGPSGDIVHYVRFIHIHTLSRIR